MSAYRAHGARMEIAGQKEACLAAYRRYRRQRLADLQVKKTKEEKDAHLASRSEMCERSEPLGELTSAQD
jgi:hypothetical protein